MAGYWSTKVTRRRAVAGLAATGIGAAALGTVGCGGGSDDSGQEEASSLINKPVDSTSKVVKGGIFSHFVTTEAANFDGLAGNNAAVSVITGFTYPFLVRNKMVKSPAAYTGEVEPDAAESFEVSTDGLQYTFKIRPSKLDARPPTNGRVVDAGDVKYSWDVFAAKSSSRTILSYAADKTAPIESVSTPDNRTVVMKLAFPYAPLLQMLGYYRHMPITPKEADGGFDVRGDMRGSGAWRLDKNSRSVSYEFRRNADFFDAANLHLDGIDLYIIPEYATGMAQFRSGQLWAYDVRAEDIISTKRDLPTLILLGDEAFTKGTTPWIGFSHKADSPFRDERVRRATSMLIDRDLWIDTFFNVSNFARDGLTAETRWHTQVSSGEDGYWIDPKNEKELGEGAKNFAYNPAEAKKLLQAAGNTKAIESVFSYTPNGYSATYTRQAEVLKGMLEANGDFKFTFNTPDYSTEWLSTNPGKYHYGNGTYDGIVQGSANTYPEIDGHLQAYYHSASIRVWHGSKDPQIDALVEKQRKELNREKRIEAIKEFQRYAAKTMPSMIAPGSALGYNLTWPWVGNRGLWRVSGSRAQTYTHLWFDKSKKS